MKREYTVEQMAENRWFYTFIEPNSKGETLVYVGGRKCLKFTYSDKKDYQDANGAIYDTVRKSWIG